MERSLTNISLGSLVILVLLRTCLNTKNDQNLRNGCLDILLDISGSFHKYIQKNLTASIIKGIFNFWRFILPKDLLAAWKVFSGSQQERATEQKAWKWGTCPEILQ